MHPFQVPDRIEDECRKMLMSGAGDQARCLAGLRLAFLSAASMALLRFS